MLVITNNIPLFPHPAGLCELDPTLNGWEEEFPSSQADWLPLRKGIVESQDQMPFVGKLALQRSNVAHAFTRLSFSDTIH